MTCEEHQEAISRFHDDELNESDSAVVFLHIGECQDCRRFMHSMVRLRHALHSKPIPSIPTSLDRRIQPKLRPYPEESVRRISSRRFFDSVIHVRASLATAIIVAALVGWGLAAAALVGDKRTRSAEPAYIMALPTVEIHGLYSPEETRN